MGEVVPFPRSHALVVALREFHEAVAELMAQCAERDRLLAESIEAEGPSAQLSEQVVEFDGFMDDGA